MTEGLACRYNQSNRILQNDGDGRDRASGAEGVSKNSQAKGLSPDCTLENTPRGVTEGEPFQANLSGQKDRGNRSRIRLPYLFCPASLQEAETQQNSGRDDGDGRDRASGAEGVSKNSQAEGLSADRTLENIPQGVTEGEPVKANLSGQKDRGNQRYFDCLCLLLGGVRGAKGGE